MTARKTRRRNPLPKFKVIKIIKTIDSNVQSSVPVSVQSFSVRQTTKGHISNVPRRRNINIADSQDSQDVILDDGLPTAGTEDVPADDLDVTNTVHTSVQKHRKTETYAVSTQ